MQIDILIPTYNRANFIGDAIDGILRQSHREYRIVVYDDGSTDNTEQLCKDYSKKCDLKYIKGEHRGVGHARNMLLENVEAKYACWQDSDDVPHAHRLEKQIHTIRENKAGVVMSYMFFFKDPSFYYQTRTVYKVDTTKYKDRDSLFENMTFATAMFRMEDIGDQKFDVTKIEGGEDVLWFTELLKNGVKFCHVPQPLYYCRRHAGRMTQIRYDKQQREKNNKVDMKKMWNEITS